MGSVVRVISWESLVKSNLALLAESFVRREMASCTVFDCYLIPCKLPGAGRRTIVIIRLIVE